MSTLIYFGTGSTQFLINPFGVPRFNKLALCTAFPPVAFCEGLFALVKFNGSIGLNWDTFDSQFNKISMQDATLCMTIGAAYLLVLGAILEVTGPKEFGQSHDWFALCRKNKAKVDKTEERRVRVGDWQTRYMDMKNVEEKNHNLEQKEA